METSSFSVRFLRLSPFLIRTSPHPPPPVGFLLFFLTQIIYFTIQRKSIGSWFISLKRYEVRGKGKRSGKKSLRQWDPKPQKIKKNRRSNIFTCCSKRKRKKKLLLLGKQCQSNVKIDVNNCFVAGFTVSGLFNDGKFQEFSLELNLMKIS